MSWQKLCTDRSTDWRPYFSRRRWRPAWSQSRTSSRSHPQGRQSRHFPGAVSSRLGKLLYYAFRSDWTAIELDWRTVIHRKPTTDSSPSSLASKFIFQIDFDTTIDFRIPLRHWLIVTGTGSERAVFIGSIIGLSLSRRWGYHADDGSRTPDTASVANQRWYECDRHFRVAQSSATRHTAVDDAHARSHSG